MLRFKLLLSGFVTTLFLFPALAAAQNVMSIVSGNGQLVCPVCPGLTTQVFSPLVVHLNDSNGNPVQNTTVTWTVVRYGVSPSTSTSTTDTTGQASYTLLPTIPVVGQSVLPATVTATAGNASASFTETVVVPNSIAPGVAPVQITLVPAGPAPALSGTAGQTLGTTVKVQVLATAGGGIQAVQVRLQSGTTAGQPTVNCASQTGQQPGTIFTDATGTAVCTPVLGQLGQGTYTVVVGGNYATFAPAQLNVTVGQAAVVKLVSGDNQSVNPGNAAPQPLMVQVTDLGGNATPGATVGWSVTQGSATLSATTTTADSNGNASIHVSAVAGPGPVKVQAKLSGSTTAQYTFTINVNVVITSVQAISALTQSATQNTAFPNPLIVQVNDGTTPVPGVTVNFVASPASGVSLSAATAVTNAQGQAQVTATAGPTPGQVTVTASVKSGSQTFSPPQPFTLNVLLPGPSFEPSGVTNAAGFQPRFIAPCSLATIFGTGIATNLQGFVVSFIEPLTQVAGVTVQFGGVFAPILSVVNDNGQESVSVQVPCEVTPGPAVPVIVTAGGVASQPVSVPVLSVAPGIFQTTMSDGVQRAVLVRPDGSFVSQDTNPARRGEIIRMYVTGLGPTTPGIATGQFVPLVQDASGNLVPQALNVNAEIVVGVNNSGVVVLSAKYAYGMIGVYEVDFQVPSDTPPGISVPFAVAVVQNNSLVFGNPSLIPVQ